MNDKEQQLISAAEEGMWLAVTKQNQASDFRIGAAVQTVQGNVYAAGSYYSVSGVLNIHAEYGAVLHAAAHGECEIMSIAIAYNDVAKKRNDNQTVYPCHICKQVLYESYLRSRINADILIIENGVVVDRIKLLDMMGRPWPSVGGV